MHLRQIRVTTRSCPNRLHKAAKGDSADNNLQPQGDPAQVSEPATLLLQLWSCWLRRVETTA
jgi:hypothetical protein